jgi:hypothetical protein
MSSYRERELLTRAEKFSRHPGETLPSLLFFIAFPAGFLAFIWLFFVVLFIL